MVSCYVEKSPKGSYRRRTLGPVLKEVRVPHAPCLAESAFIGIVDVGAKRCWPASSWSRHDELIPKHLTPSSERNHQIWYTSTRVQTKHRTLYHLPWWRLLLHKGRRHSVVPLCSFPGHDQQKRGCSVLIASAEGKQPTDILTMALKVRSRQGPEGRE